MGHADIQTTMDIYAECTQEKKQEVFANLNGKIMIKQNELGQLQVWINPVFAAIFIILQLHTQK